MYKKNGAAAANRIDALKYLRNIPKIPRLFLARTIVSIIFEAVQKPSF